MHQWLERPMAGVRQLWSRARNEHASPTDVGWAVAFGVFAGCTPFLGFHMWIALALATIFKKNRLWAFVGSRVSSNLLFVWIAFTEIELGHRIRTGAWAPLAPREALAHGKELFFDWCLGAAIVGGALAAVIGLGAYLTSAAFGARQGRQGP